MPLTTRIESAIAEAIRAGQGGVAPPQLASALHYATAPGGARIRPTICITPSEKHYKQTRASMILP